MPTLRSFVPNRHSRLRSLCFTDSARAGPLSIVRHIASTVREGVCSPLVQAPDDVLIYRAKFFGSLPSAFALGEVLGEGLSRALAAGRLELPQALIPVPLHHRRLRQRGFNQAQLIAQRVAKRFAVPLRPRWVSRRRDTMMQSSLKRPARQRNVANAFRATLPKGVHVAIIDDVMTTGATATALAWTLLEAGAARVDAWTVARAGNPDDESVISRFTLRV